jgi:hypothetical protein
MILDSLLMFTGASSTNPSLGDGRSDAPTAGTQLSSGIVDIGLGRQLTTNPLGLAIPDTNLGGGARDLGIGDDPALKLFVTVTQAFVGGTSLQVNFMGAPDDGTGQPGTFTTYASGPINALAQLIQGAYLFDIDVPRPPVGVPLPRYWQLQYVSAGTFTAGAIQAYVVLDRFDQIQSPAAYLSGYLPGITIPN